MSNTMEISPSSPRTRFVALDVKDRNKILAEGITAKSTITKARKTGKNFILAFVPKRDETYIY